MIIHYNFASGSYSYESLGGGWANAIQDHPEYLPYVLQPWNGFHSGYDVALISVGAVPTGTPGYALDPSAKATVFGRDIIVTGRGATGYGANGESHIDNWNRAGWNTYESDRVEGLMSEFLINEYTNEDTMIAYDFEQPGNPATSWYDEYSTAGWGLDEVCQAHGDSGGPTFSPNGLLTGVHSFGVTPFDDYVDSNWGDVGVDIWMGHPEIYNWVQSVAYGVVGWTGAGGSSTPPIVMSQSYAALTDGANWYGGATPTNTDNAEIRTGGEYVISGPASGQVFSAKSLYLGGSDGDKSIDHSASGSINIATDLILQRYNLGQ